MITPSSNTVIEPVTIAVTGALYPRLTTHYSRIEVKTISLDPDSLAHFDLEPMLTAALLLADAGVDVIAWNGTSGAWRGLDADLALCRAIAHCTGVQATTSTLAQIEAFKAFGVQTYALAVPYLETVTRAILPTYAGAGFQCSGWGCLGISVNTEFAYVPQDTTRDLVRRCNSNEAEAVAIICTNLPAAWLVEDLEAELGKPIFDSTLVTVWHALRMVGFDEPLAGWGRLLRAPVKLRV
jgi:maleate isomerase